MGLEFSLVGLNRIGRRHLFTSVPYGKGAFRRQGGGSSPHFGSQTLSPILSFIQCWTYNSCNTGQLKFKLNVGLYHSTLHSSSTWTCLVTRPSSPTVSSSSISTCPSCNRDQRSESKSCCVKGMLTGQRPQIIIGPRDALGKVGHGNIS